MAAPGTLELLGREVARLFEPLEDRFTPDRIETTLAGLGLQLPAELATAPKLTDALGKAVGSATTLADLVVAIEDAIEGGNAAAIISAGGAMVAKINDTAQAIAAVASAFHAMSTDLAGLSAPQRDALRAFAEVFVERIMARLVVDLLEQRYRELYITLVLAGAIELIDVEVGPPDSLQPRYRRIVLHFDRVLRLVTDPLGLLRDVYRWGAKDFDGLALFRAVQLVLESTTGLSAVLLKPAGMPATLEAVMVSATVDPSGPMPGLEVSLRAAAEGDVSDNLTQDDWTFELSAKARAAADAEFVIKPPLDVHLQAPPGSVDAALTASVRRASEAGPLVVFGETDGSRLELKSLTAGIGITEHWDAGAVPAPVSPKLNAAIQGGTLVITGAGGDSFVSEVLNGVDIVVPFDLAASWSPDTGLVLSSGAELVVEIPAHVEIGPIEVDSIFVGLSLAGGALEIILAATIGAKLGPLTAVVDRLGLRAQLGLPPAGGNVGPVQVDFRFKLPNGVGLSFESATVTLAGFLAHDDAKHEYSGVLQLQFIDLALQAFGLITTQVAGGSGYSLLALVDAEFPPVQLGWGFTLNGVGGLIAIHRTASTDALHAALKAGQLSSILFPKNAITNAPAILAQLDTLFPTAPGRFLFGPMALIGWGTPQVLRAAIAVVVELPEPVRVILLARIEARLPDASLPQVRINMDALGVLDLGRDELSFDAVLFDSKLVGFTLSGAMALRATWATQREFVLAIGGLHPRFTPPAGFPTLQRITIDMPSGIVSKLRLAAYLALTSNSIQIGANLDVFIGVSGFGLSGHLGFDALLQRHPFRFDADISGSVALMAGGDDIASVSLDATLTGPAPYHIAGKFKVHIVFFTVHVSFNHSWGEDTPSLPLPSVDVAALLGAALAERDSWDALLPDGVRPLVSVRQIADAGRLLAHPLARPQVHERVVPRGRGITRFGEAVPSTGTQCTITDLHIGSGGTIAHEAIEDDFAPAQFFELTEEEKLARPSFERHDAGVRVAASPDLVTIGAPVAIKTTEYETFYIDEPGGAVRQDPVRVKPPLGDLVVLLPFGAAKLATIESARGRYQAAGHPIRVAEPAFVVVDKSTLTSSGIGPAAGATVSNLHALIAGNRNLQIVAVHEMRMAA